MSKESEECRSCAVDGCTKTPSKGRVCFVGGMATRNCKTCHRDRARKRRLAA